MKRSSSSRIAVFGAALGAILLAITVVDLGRATADTGATINGTVTSSNRRYLVNAVVWLEGVRGNFPPPAHPVPLDQRGLQFVPRVLPVVKGTTVRFLNSDAASHNVYSPEGSYDLGNFPGGQHADRAFPHEGVFTQLCHLHPAMISYVVVVPNTHFALTAADGSFHLANVPAGTYQLKAWQEHARGGPVSVTVPATGAVTAAIPLQRAAN